MQIQVRIQPRSSQEKIVEGSPAWKIYVRQSPTDGQANEAVRRLLARRFGIPVSRVCIIRGELTRTKTIEIQGG